MSISAKIVADSTSHLGIRLTTFELEFPKFILPQVLTHKMLSRNTASSRAIPTKRLIEQVRENPAMPIHWGKNQSGMQAGEEHNVMVSLAMFTETEKDLFERVNVSSPRERAWRYAAQTAADIAEEFGEAGYHKQIVNRLLDPFVNVKMVLTATETDNFFWLRRHEDAQYEIQELADQMWEVMQKSSPVQLGVGEWHLPYVDLSLSYDGEGIQAIKSALSEVLDEKGVEECLDKCVTKQELLLKANGLTLEQAKKISASCCAQVSYRRNDTSLDKAEKIHDKLIGGDRPHSSAFEHQATPMGNLMGKTWEYSPIRKRGVDRDEPGVTHRDVNNMAWSANLRGWVQYRQLIPNNACWQYEEEE